MKLVIDITEDGYKIAQALCLSDCADDFHKAIAKGIVIDKSMRLVDANKAIKDIDEICKKQNIDIRDDILLKHTRTFIKRLPTIIEVDKENKHENNN